MAAAVEEGALPRRTPETTPAISARHKSTFVSAPAEGSAKVASPGGQTEKYSPPVPNLHTGSLRLLLSTSILASSHST